MNASNAKDYLPLVQALADGKVIQEWCNVNQKWHDALEADFAIPSTMYRIKPEPKEIWVNEYPGGDEYMHKSEREAHAHLNGGITRHYREVIE